MVPVKGNIFKCLIKHLKAIQETALNPEIALADGLFLPYHTHLAAYNKECFKIIPGK